MNKKIFLVTFLFLLPVLAIGDTFDRFQQHDSRLERYKPALRQPGSSAKMDLAPSAQDVSDLLISETFSPARFNQDKASIVSMKNGSWMAAWVDNRLGASKIFIQQFDASGTPVSGNELGAGAVNGIDYVDPKLKVDTAGRVYLFYRDQTRGLIFGVRLNEDLSINLSEFLVNDTSLTSYAGPFDFAVYPDGRMVVVWENYSALGSVIQMKIYNSTGTVYLAPTTVNANSGSASHWVPSVAVQPNSGFLVCWEDYRNGRADIYARQFNGSGVPVSGDFTIVPPPADAFDQYTPKVIYSSIHNYIIGWVDTRNNQHIYFQRYSPTAGLVGANQQVSTISGGSVNWDINLAGSPAGRLFVSWASFGETSNIMGVRFSTDLMSIGLPRELNQSQIFQRWAPAVNFGGENRFGVVWTDFADNDPDIRMMLFDTLFNRALVNEVIVNDDTHGAVSETPRVVTAGNWYNLITFTDKRNDAGDIYIQSVTHAGSKIGVNRRVNADFGNNLQTEPDIAYSNGKALVVWIDGRAVGGVSGQRIYGRYADVYGTLVSSEFAISDADVTDIKADPKAVLRTDGQGLVVWVDRQDIHHIKGHWLDSDGNPDGSDFNISDLVNDLDNNKPFVGVDGSDRYYVIWRDDGQAETTIKGAWYNSDRSAGGTFSWTPDLGGVEIEDFAASVNGFGDIYLLWSSRGEDQDLYLTVLDRDGMEIESPMALVTDEASIITDPSVAADEHGYTACSWIDDQSGILKASYLILKSDFTPVSPRALVSEEPVEFMTAPSITAIRGRAWFTWADPRANGLNIYAGNYLYLPTGVDDDDPILPEAFVLNQNYPNPFNPTTTISFNLPEKSDISLEVYNLLGQKVKVLASGSYNSGTYRISWNGTSETGNRVASGIYFYKLRANDFTDQKKMILLK